MSILLNKHNFAVAAFAAEEESRYTLRGILVTQRETVGTNGHYLVRVSNPTTKPESFPVLSGLRNGGAFKNFILPVDACKEIEKALPKKTHIPILKHALVAHFAETEGGDVKPNIGVTDLDSPKVFTPRTLEGQFPNWQAVIPTKAPSLSICVNAQYLAKLAADAAKFAEDKRRPFVRLQFTDNQSPIRLDAQNSETGQGWTALLMPVRDGGCHGENNVADVKAETVDAFAMVERNGTIDPMYARRMRLNQLRAMSAQLAAKLPA